MKKVMVLEDEKAISEFVVINLKRSGYEPLVASTGEQALSLVRENPDILVALLDVMLPDIDGYEVCRRIREMGRQMGIIMVTARSQEMDRVTGLMIGADDYVTKPFSTTELIARVDALVRRLSPHLAEGNSEQKNERELTVGEFRLDLKNRTVYKKGVPIELTQTEFAVLKYILGKRGEAVSRDELMSSIWGEEYVGDSKIVDVNLRRLRVKLEDDPAEPRHLVAVWGLGYKWVD
ncbi:MAG: response regulator transcription factor [Clostridia bacterium]|nr:response regulator transcription factor [Clostridia bacterium]